MCKHYSRSKTHVSEKWNTWIVPTTFHKERKNLTKFGRSWSLTVNKKRDPKLYPHPWGSAEIFPKGEISTSFSGC